MIALGCSHRPGTVYNLSGFTKVTAGYHHVVSSLINIYHSARSSSAKVPHSDNSMSFCNSNCVVLPMVGAVPR